MKKVINIILVMLLTSCSLNENKDNEIISLNETIQNQQIQIDTLNRKQELTEKIEKIKNWVYKKKEEKLRSEIEELKKSINLEEKEAIKLDTEKLLNIKFYSQFPLDISTWLKYEEPYQNFCEESSLLNWYYFLIWKEPSLKEYNEDLLKLKELEELLFNWWYKHTSIEDTLKLLIAFQWDDQKVFWEIIENPSIEDIKHNISKWNPIIVPVYWKWLSNSLFISWWPVYHNLLIKWYTEQIFIVNEVWVSKWDWYNYKINELMENIYNYDAELYPDNFRDWKKEILILYK